VTCWSSDALRFSSSGRTGRKSPLKAAAATPPFVFSLDFLLVVPHVKRHLGKKIEKIWAISVVNLIREILIGIPNVILANTLLNEKPIVIRINLDYFQDFRTILFATEQPVLFHACPKVLIKLYRSISSCTMRSRRSPLAMTR